MPANRNSRTAVASTRHALSPGHSAYFRPIALLGLLLLFAGAVYWPGLAGGFVFDDFANLPALGRYGGVHDWASLTWYATSGIADPTGRPVSMLSFLVDARDWPADPWPFKRTNLLLHLVNGVLLYSLLAALGQRVMPDPRVARQAALLGAGLWLLHPLWASTVFYVIQRHAMLATCFVLCGLRAWVASRDAFDAGRIGKGWALAICAMPLFGLLAGLSKANGFLLPLLIAVLQITLLAKNDPPWSSDRSNKHQRASALLLAWLPALLLVCGLMLEGARAWSGVAAQRGWTLGERLLTQPRALVDYLHALFAPGLEARGVFTDDFVVSTSVLTPSTTLPALLVVITLLALGVALRRRAPTWAATVLFYFAGHAMESTVVPLELYFEHRNYLPAVLLGWPIALWACSRRKRHRRLLVSGVTMLIVLFAALTATQATLWGHPAALARTWAATYPNSVRAQAYAAAVDMGEGRTQAAIDRLEPLARAQPEEPQLALPLLNAKCAAGTVRQRDVAAAARSLRAGGVSVDLNYLWMSRQLADGGTTAGCRVVREELQASLLPAVLHQPAETPEAQARSAYLRGLDALRRTDCSAALEAFNARITIQRRPEFVQTQVGLLGTHCDATTALRHLDGFLASGAPYSRSSNAALRTRDWLMARDGYWTDEFDRLRATLVADRDVTHTVSESALDARNGTTAR